MSELINDLAAMWWAWMWPMLWQVSVVVGLIWAIDMIIRRRVWPQVRYALWLLVLVKLVLPPGLTLSTSVTSGLGPLVKETVRSPIFAGNAGSPVKSERIGPAAAGDGLTIKPVIGSDVPTVVEPIIAVEEVSKAGVKLSWQAYVMLGWLAGMVVLAVWVAVRFWQLRGLHRGADEVELPERLGRLVQETARKLKLGRVPKVVLSHNVTSPAVFGAFRPVLLMPAGEVSNLSRKSLEHVLLHEFAHVKRGDLKVHALWMVLQIIYWFNPLLWFVRRQLQHLRELCCDATVARILREETVDYRETILETGRRLLAHPVEPGMGLLGLFEDSSRLVVRLKWLEKKTWKYRGLRMVTVFAVVALMTACVLPMAATGKNKEAGIGDSVLEGPAFTATLSSGVTVELLAVCEHPSEGRQWWRPDGTAMKEAPYEKAKCEPIASRDEEFDQLREFAVRFSGPDLGKVNITFVVPAAVRLSASSGTRAGETESVTGIACELPKFLESHEVRVGVASGEWETAGTQGAGFRANITQETDSGTITWAVPSEVKGEAMIEVAHPFVEDNIRIVAEDKQRRVVTACGSRGGGTRMWGAVRVTFGLPLSQISKFHIQRRPYQWVKFKDVSLKAGLRTNVQVKVSEHPINEQQGDFQRAIKPLSRKGIILRPAKMVRLRYWDEVFDLDSGSVAAYEGGMDRWPKGADVGFEIDMPGQIRDSVFFGINSGYKKLGTRFLALKSHNLEDAVWEISDRLEELQESERMGHSFEKDVHGKFPVMFVVLSDGYTPRESESEPVPRLAIIQVAEIANDAADINYWLEAKPTARPHVQTGAAFKPSKKLGTPVKLNAYVKEQAGEETRKERIREKLRVLEEARYRVERELDFAERALDEVRERYGISDLEERSYPHPITSRLMRLEQERDDCAVETVQLQARIENLQKEPASEETDAIIKKARDDLVVLLEKYERLEQMREEAAAKKRDLDLARVQYNQRASIRDERRRMLDLLKAETENLRIIYDDPEAAWPGTEGETRR